MDNSSGVGVLDKAALVLTALEQGPTTLAGLVPLLTAWLLLLNIIVSSAETCKGVSCSVRG